MTLKPSSQPALSVPAASPKSQCNGLPPSNVDTTILNIVNYSALSIAKEAASCDKLLLDFGHLFTDWSLSHELEHDMNLLGVH